jgi:hypothetical protein
MVTIIIFLIAYCSMSREFRTKELPLLNRIFFSWIFFVNG